MQSAFAGDDADEIAKACVVLRDRIRPFPFLSAPGPEEFTVVTEGLPSGWSENGNLLLSSDKTARPNIVTHPGLPLATNAIVAIGYGCLLPSVIMVWGDGPVVWLGPQTGIPACYLHCDGRSTIAIGGNLSSAGETSLNARNGGAIAVGSDGLWSNRVYIATDDMHAILDRETGARINPHGGQVSVGPHVWLGTEAMVLGGAEIGEDCVVGARSVVKAAIPPGSVVAGSPARIIRDGVTWSHDDVPPG